MVLGTGRLGWRGDRQPCAISLYMSLVVWVGSFLPYCPGYLKDPVLEPCLVTLRGPEKLR
jgi:hypothetical protein